MTGGRSIDWRPEAVLHLLIIRHAILDAAVDEKNSLPKYCQLARPQQWNGSLLRLALCPWNM
jgi:hypothetical protein